MLNSNLGHEEQVCDVEMKYISLHDCLCSHCVLNILCIKINNLSCQK